MQRMRYRQAVRAALADELAADPTVIVLGEDVAAAGGAFKATEGLLEEFGPDRVIDTPIAELGFLGAGVGAAMTGLRPVVEMMFIEFVGVALDQLVTEAATMRYLSRGDYGVPLVVRGSVGAGQGFGCQHSQVLDHWFRGAPGLKVCMPATPQDAYGLLRSAVRDPDPVVVLEPRILYGERGPVVTGPEGLVPLGRARVVRAGADVTVVAAGAMVRVAEAAAAAAGFDAEVLDLRSLQPWDRTAVLESVIRTGALVTVEESPAASGWGAPVVADVVTELHGQLHAPPLRLTTPDAPVPFAEGLEARFLPSPAYVAEQVARLLADRRAPRPWWQQEVAV
jgi:pyruvate dehydrogenase E1 component beta subunit